MKKLHAILAAARPMNLLLTVISVIVGFWFCSSMFISFKSLLAALSAALICGGGNLFNDYYDKDVDTINRPSRPLPSGKVTEKDLIISGLMSFAVGITFSFHLGIICIFLAFLTVLLLMIYNFYAKRTVLAGNFIVSSLAGLAFVYGAAAAGDLIQATVPAIFAFLYHFGREILKDIEDIPGDENTGIVTFPVRFGTSPALLLAGIIFTVLIILTIIPFLFLGYSQFYLLVVLVGVDLLIIVSMTRYMMSLEYTKLKQLNILLKVGMFAGIFALILK